MGDADVDGGVVEILVLLGLVVVDDALLLVFQEEGLVERLELVDSHREDLLLDFGEILDRDGAHSVEEFDGLELVGVEVVSAAFGFKAFH